MRRTCQKKLDRTKMVGDELFHNGKYTPEVETLSNFCPSRFSQVYLDFYCLQDTLSVQICVMKKMSIWIHLRKSRRTEIVESFRLYYKKYLHQKKMYNYNKPEGYIHIFLIKTFGPCKKRFFVQKQKFC